MNTKAIFNRIYAIALVVGLLAPGLAKAQQNAMYTQFFSNKLVLNPAYAGARDALSLTAFYRNQWTGFAGAPVTQTFSVHTPIFKGRSGVGISLIHDKIGIVDNTILKGAYAYRIDLGGARLSLGLNGEFRRRAMNWAAANPLEQADPSIAWTGQNLFLPNFGAGIYLDTDHMYLGVSMPQLLENELNYFPQGGNSQNLAQLRRHFFAMAGLGINISESLEFKPQALFKYVRNAPMELDLNLSLLINSRFWVGGTYRTGDSYDVFFQYWITEEFRFGYAFDFTFTRLNPYNYGSHELMIGLDLGRKRKGFVHPRFF